MNSRSGAIAAAIARMRLLRFDQYLLFGLLPALLPFVRRAGPPLLVLAALLSALSLLSDQRARRAFDSLFRSVPILVVTAFLCWATATLFWTPWLSRGAAAVASGWLIFGAFVVLDKTSEKGWPVQKMLAVSVFAGSVFVLLDLLGRRFGYIQTHVETFRFNMVLVSLVLLFCACLRRDGAGRLSIVAAGTALVAAVALGESETAKLAFAIGVVSYLVALIIPRTYVAIGLFICLCLCWFGFLWIAPIATKFASFLPGLAKEGHAAERLAIWSAFSQLAIAGLPWGWGVESVAIAPALPYFATAPAAIQSGLNWMHPHNNIIQIVAEMGAPGIVLGFAVSLIAVWWVQENAKLAAPRAALVGAIFTVALISHGFWQMWFWTAVAAAILALRTQDKNEPAE